ncbi:MAG: ATP-binding cassette domain-containing protein [Clostridia bacterium]|nr:ATP-binding cassette domain-containing protein [Clostridia bacterium]
MLRLENISKSYISGGVDVPALKNVTLNFRKNEFVSILGQSGCGKTTLLNIIGGLDRYTSGDLVIAGKSTKEYTDKDWDSYRNHTIGFVFQNYNLIMHLSVLDNVEMALILAGLSREERRQKSIDALKSVGLGEHIHKKPNQLSGGQMQRVAIARAIVNNPKIILADEPTGALDTETSIQIMEILKELSKDKLIIMVTHNPELAEEYSTRIVRVLDGVVKDDTMPYSEIEEKAERVSLEVVNEESQESSQQDVQDKVTSQEVQEDINAGNQENVNQASSSQKTKKKKVDAHISRKEKTSMSFFTALKLSLQNLRTKKARTILTSIAGSIGIIGVALILALSNGFQAYVDKMQMDTLSSYPLTIERNATDITALSGAFEEDEVGRKLDKVYVNKIYEKLMNTQKNNKITQEYIDEAIKTIDSSLYYDIQYKRDAQLNIYRQISYNGVPAYQDVNASMGSGVMSMSLWSELVGNKDFIDLQYDLVYGDYPQNPSSENMHKEHQVVIVLNQENEISDIVLQMLGWTDNNKESYTYDEIIGTEFKLILNDGYYDFDAQNNKFVKQGILQENYENGITLKIVGILKLNEETSMGSIQGTIAYLPSLTDYVLETESTSEIVTWQKANPTLDCFTGQEFAGTTDDEKAIAYNDTLRKISGETLPSSISIYPIDFKAKEEIKLHLDEYNEEQENDEDKVYYTDLMEIMVSTINTVINAISYVLIAFTSISLVVSSLMIGIITYVSVLERIKEIGILRSIGARKKDISRVFNAETLIIGFCAGFIGVVFTLLVSIPINIILESVIGISNISALPWLSAILLVIISMGLTLVAGLIPARIAAKKDPVVALRSE